jgi:hypothetical protein
MPATYEPIATTTLGTAAATIAFTSIPSTYTDLRLTLVGTCTSTATFGNFIINSTSSGNLYSYTVLNGDGSSAASGRGTSANNMPLGFNYQFSTTIPSFNTVDLFSYAGSTNKTVLVTNSADNNGSGLTESMVGLFRSTSAITALTLRIGGVNWAIGTTATLYGIKNA